MCKLPWEGNTVYREVVKMKKSYVLSSAIALSLALAACGTAADDTDNAVDESITEESNQGTATRTDSQTDSSVTDEVEPTSGTANEQDTNSGATTSNQDDMQQKMDEIDYADFGLSVDYANNDEYEAELEKNSNNSVEAEIDDSLNQVKMKGADAFNELYPLVKQLTITQKTSKEDAIKEVIKVFNLPDDYRELELEIRFKDGTKIEFEDKK